MEPSAIVPRPERRSGFNGLLHELSVGELLVGYRGRFISPVDVMRAVLKRAEQAAHLNAFVALDGERALDEARESEQRWQRGRPLGLLDGVPVSVKDLLAVRGFPTRLGSRTSATERASEDAPVAARLREHGAILFAKTTTSEYGLKGLGDSPLTGITRNAHDGAHTAGGSSAGAVTAVAAGVGPIAIGTDGGGSIRVPSAYSGVVGFKPSFGRVPTAPAMVVGAPPHVGPIARSVEDVARVLTVITRADDRDPYRLPADARDYTDGLSRPLAGLRIGASATLGYVTLDPHVRAAFMRAFAVFRKLGATVVEEDPGFASPAHILHTLFVARAASTVAALSDAQRAELDPHVARAAEEGAALSALTYLEAERARTLLAQQLADYHRRFDLLLTPSSAGVAPRVDGSPGADSSPREPSSFAAPFSLTRQPAISIPMDTHPSGLPIGLQIVGRHFEDALVLRAAANFESATARFPARLPLG